MLENKLAWAPGSIDTILAGGEPQETVVELRRTTPNPLSHTATDALSRASTEELLLELRRRIIAPRTRRHDTWDDSGGLDPHGDWPEEGLQPAPDRSLARPSRGLQRRSPWIQFPAASRHAAVGNALTDRTPAHAVK